MLDAVQTSSADAAQGHSSAEQAPSHGGALPLDGEPLLRAAAEGEGSRRGEGVPLLSASQGASLEDLSSSGAGGDGTRVPLVPLEVDYDLDRERPGLDVDDVDLEAAQGTPNGSPGANGEAGGGPWKPPKKVAFADTVQVFGGDTESDASDSESHLRKVIASSIIGNTLEWYDFLIYTFLGGVITKLFFPHDDVYAQMLAFYGVFAAGFATRPLGALVFGQLSDRYSRKTALMLSIVVMSIPTALVGCLPTYEQAGVVAPLLLVVIRVLQGFAVGGEFTATMVFLVEHAPPPHRGLHGSWAFASVLVGVIVGSFVAMAFTLALSEAAMMAWGWRLPFLLSILGSGVGVYIRRHLRDPVTEEEDEHRLQHNHNHHTYNPGGGGGGGGSGGSSGPSSGSSSSPSLLRRGLLRRLAAGVAEVVLLDFMTATGFYLVVIFLPLYMQNFVHLSKRVALSIHTANMLLYLALIPLGGWLSDKHGRARVILLPALAMAAAAYPLWLLFKTGNAGAAWAAQAAMAGLMALFTGALPATFAALFPAEYRCTGLSIGHNISMAAFGGTAPIMATALLRGTGDIASPAALLIISAALTACGALLLRRWRIK